MFLELEDFSLCSQNAGNNYFCPKLFFITSFKLYSSSVLCMCYLFWSSEEFQYAGKTYFCPKRFYDSLLIVDVMS
jgi:hypothetical protein